jgi:hypothetical protein
MSLAKGPGIHVQRLRLHDSQWTHQPLLSTLDLLWLVDVVKDHMPNLTVLDLMLTGFPDGNDPPLHQSIVDPIINSGIRWEATQDPDQGFSI